jgi:hypothetical protein
MPILKKDVEKAVTEVIKSLYYPGGEVPTLNTISITSWGLHNGGTLDPDAGYKLLIQKLKEKFLNPATNLPKLNLNISVNDLKAMENGKKTAADLVDFVVRNLSEINPAP